MSSSQLSYLISNSFTLANMDTLSERIQTILDECEDRLGENQQAALGRIAGASNSVVSQWMNGKIKSMDPKYAFNIEKQLGYNGYWLMLGKPHSKMKPEEPAEQAPNGTPMFSAAERALLYVDVFELRLITAYREATELGRAGIEEAARLAPKRSMTGYLAEVSKRGNSNHSPDKK
jgi:hypothetical protein